MGSGSGGPAVYLAAERGCRGHRRRHQRARRPQRPDAGRSRAVSPDRARFEAVDASRPLPFPAGTFDAIVSNDAMCHIADRPDVLRDWHRVLRPGGRILFTDALVVTGPVTHEELATRSSIGFYLFVPPGVNEAMLREAGFEILRGAGRHGQRRRGRAPLARRPGAPSGGAGGPGGRGQLRRTAALPALRPHALGERRLSRFAYLAERPRG